MWLALANRANEMFGDSRQRVWSASARNKRSLHPQAVQFVFSSNALRKRQKRSIATEEKEWDLFRSLRDAVVLVLIRLCQNVLAQDYIGLVLRGLTLY